MIRLPIAFALLLATTTTLYANDVDVELINPIDWTEAEQTEIKEATALAFSRMLRADVANCAYRNSFKGDRDKLRQKWGREIPVLNKTKKVKISVRKTKDKVLGKALVGKAVVDRKNHQVFDLEIFLNNEELHSYISRNKDMKKLDQWANTIAHEVAHSFGHSHGKSGNWSADYPGYFPTEIGFCVASDGKTGSQGK